MCGIRGQIRPVVSFIRNGCIEASLGLEKDNSDSRKNLPFVEEHVMYIYICTSTVE